MLFYTSGSLWRALSGFQDDRSCEWRIKWEKSETLTEDYAHINGESRFKTQKNKDNKFSSALKVPSVASSFFIVNTFLHFHFHCLQEINK